MSPRQYYISVSILAIVAVLLTVVATVPSFRQYFRDYFLSDKRTVLARADGLLESATGGPDDQVSVVKVQTMDTLSLEIYTKTAASNQLVFQKRIVLPEHRDGYFTFRGNATNLVLSDVDGDGHSEIIAPTFDENLVPRLNIYKYVPQSQSFVRLGPESMGL